MSQDALTLTELLIVVAIIGITASIASFGVIQSVQRNRSNTIIVALAGWLESLRTSASRGNTCTGIITLGSMSSGTSIGSVSTVASETSSSCFKESVSVPSTYGRFNFTLSSSDSATATQKISFTRRGSVYPNPSSKIILTLTGSSALPSRCLVIDGLAGNISLGVPSGTDCTVDGRF